jgi:putative ABC transport system substrate-binding protein
MRLDLLKQTVPDATRVAVLWNVANHGMKLRFQETEAAAPKLGVAIDSIGVRTPDDFEDAFQRMAKRPPHGLLVLADTVTMGHLTRTVQFAEANRVPAIYEAKEFVEAGGLMSYGIDFSDQYRRAATLVDKILRGAKPADLPIEQPRKFEFVINLKAAKALGLTVPPSILARADRLID